jgi:diaminohydroxyphosphoribosylaminopyrimidine deaminase/5-amino-6-(5-phosphoribosylamino)uracil reductase
VGSGTALADEPSLTARPVDATVDRQPMRVLLDARGRVPAAGPLFDPSEAPTLVCTSAAARSAAVEAWTGAGAKVEVLPTARGGGVDLVAMLELLAREGVLQAMVEGGPTVHGALLRAALADRIVAYVAGAVLGADGTPAFGTLAPATLADAPRLRLDDARALGDDVRLDYTPVSERA